MSLLEVIVLALIQGVAEFLPISSTGHLALARWLFGWDDPGLGFDVAVHAGTLAALVWVFRREIVAVLRGLRGEAAPVDGLPPRRLIWLGLIATVPLVIIGAPLYEALEGDLRGPTTAAAFLLVTGALIAAAEWRARRTTGESLATLTPARAAAIGVAQAVAALPGISRAGMCIVAGDVTGAEPRGRHPLRLLAGAARAGGRGGARDSRADRGRGHGAAGAPADRRGRLVRSGARVDSGAAAAGAHAVADAVRGLVPARRRSHADRAGGGGVGIRSACGQLPSLRCGGSGDYGRTPKRGLGLSS